MNAKTRKEIEDIMASLEDAKERLEGIIADEQEKLDNMESFSGTERYQEMEEGISQLEEACSSIDDAINNLPC